MKKLLKIKISLLLIFYKLIDFTFIKFYKLTNFITDNTKTLVLTGSDEFYYTKLINLLNSFLIYEKNTLIKIIDLGMNFEQLEHLRKNYKNIEIKNFKFKNYPKFFNERDEFNKLGSYAWKGVSVYEEYLNSKKEITYLIWLDAGCVLNGTLDNARFVLEKIGFFSPYSSLKIYELTHPTTLDKFNLNKKILKRKNLSSGVVGFNLNDEKAIKIIEKWNKYSRDKDFISPEGSSRLNHRQDQSILNILASLIYPSYKLIKLYSSLNIKIHYPSNELIYFSQSNPIIRNKIYKNIFKYVTNDINNCDIVWLFSIEDLNLIPIKHLKSKFVICNYDFKSSNIKRSIKVNYINFYLHERHLNQLTSNNRQMGEFIKNLV